MINDFTQYVMFCNSTGNQTVNLLPALQFKIKNAIIFSTAFTEDKGLTKRLIDIMKNNGINADSILINNEEEKNPVLLTDKLLLQAKKYEKIIWNISGGQKIPSIAFQRAFERRIEAGFKDDYILYLEANPPETWFFGNAYKMQKIRTCANLSLNDILYLYGFEALPDLNKLYPNPSEEVKKNIEIGKKALNYYVTSDIFREAFFGFMKPDESEVRTIQDIKELIRKTLNSVKPSVNDIKVTKAGYENLEDTIKEIFSEKATDIKKCKELLKKLKIIEKPSEIYQNYWDEIKRRTIDKVCEKIEKNEVKFISRDINRDEINALIQQIKELGGEVTLDDKTLYRKNIKKFSSLGKNGYLFEWMVASSVLDEINSIENKNEYVSEIYHSVKTKKLGSADKHDSELDLVIVTKFGTLIILELKTYEFSGDLAQAQEGLAYKKSGPYGKALIIGPLLKSMVKHKDDGSVEYPSHIQGPIKAQEAVAKQNNIDYYYLDQIPEMLREKLFIRRNEYAYRN